MPRNEDGELELILGNRQLLSVFFIIVFLLGVFFAMGYLVGRNSVAAPPDLTARAGRPEALPPPADTPPTRRTEPERPREPVKEPAKEPVKEPVKETPKEPEPAPKKTEPKPEAPKAAERGGVQTPESGATYLQLTATKKADCESYVGVLRKKGFRAIYAAVPEKEDLYRVLVGPLPDAAAVNKTRADLDEAGFPGGKAIRKTF